MMNILRSKEQDNNVAYIQHAYLDTMTVLTNAMSEYEQFRLTGDFDAIRETRDKLDEAMLALSDLSESIQAFIPPVEALIPDEK